MFSPTYPITSPRCILQTKKLFPSTQRCIYKESVEHWDMLFWRHSLMLSEVSVSTSLLLQDSKFERVFTSIWQKFSLPSMVNDLRLWQNVGFLKVHLFYPMKKGQFLSLRLEKKFLICLESSTFILVYSGSFNDPDLEMLWSLAAKYQGEKFLFPPFQL